MLSVAFLMIVLMLAIKFCGMKPVKQERENLDFHENVHYVNIHGKFIVMIGHFYLSVSKKKSSYMYIVIARSSLLSFKNFNVAHCSKGILKVSTPNLDAVATQGA